MITIKHLDHISMGHADWKAQSDLVAKLFGFKFLGGWPGMELADFDGCTLQVPGTDIEFEIISPTRPDSFVEKFLREQGPGLHHITVEVPDIKQAAKDLEDMGIRPFGGITDDGAWHITYIHPKDSGGILWQLFEPHIEPRELDRTTSPGLTGVKRVDHVSMAVPDIEKQLAWQKRVFGMEQISSWTDENLGYHGAEMTIPNSQLKFEIIAPSRPDSFVQKFIAERRAGMHHITMEVESVDKAVEGLRSAGIEAFGGIIESDWHKHTFVHPKDSGGVLWQLFEE